MLFLNEMLKLEPQQNNRIATVIEGRHQGKKAIYIDGGLYDSQGSPEFFVNMNEACLEETSSMLTEIDGERVFIESLLSEPKIVICGGGHVSIPVIKMAKMSGFHVTVLEDRPTFANNARSAGADLVICDSFEKGLANVRGDFNTFFVIVTRGHRYDAECLEMILPKTFRYIGMIGSKKRVAAVKQLMEEKGFSKEILEELHSPIGLKIGAETPAEIAVSIMAEIISVKNKQVCGSGFTTEILDYLNGEWKQMKFPVAVVTIISRKGSAPRGIGTKMLVVRTGKIIGTIGGGCAEAAVLEQAIQCMENKTSKLYQVDMTGKEAEEDGMVCGGVIEVFIDCCDLF